MNEKEAASKGVLYIAKDRDSFSKLYEGITEKIFVPSLKYMPTQEELKVRMKRGLEEVEPLSDGQAERFLNYLYGKRKKKSVMQLLVDAFLNTKKGQEWFQLWKKKEEQKP